MAKDRKEPVEVDAEPVAICSHEGQMLYNDLCDASTTFKPVIFEQTYEKVE